MKAAALGPSSEKNNMMMMMMMRGGDGLSDVADAVYRLTAERVDRCGAQSLRGIELGLPRELSLGWHSVGRGTSWKGVTLGGRACRGAAAANVASGLGEGVGVCRLDWGGR